MSVGIVVAARRRFFIMSAFVISTAHAGSNANAQWMLASTRTDTLRIGYMLQPRGEWRLGSAGTPQNLFLRHLRVLAGGRVLRTFTFFLGTDAPNLNKTLPDGTKPGVPMGIYDFWITFDPRDEFKIEAGLMGTPNSHNSIQSISGMLASDFGPYSFVSTPATGEKAGRDYGIQIRGYVLGGHLEYRSGAFRAYRSPSADHALRYVSRIVVDAFQAERSVYYSGTSIGAARHVALGASVDHQERYNSVGGDLFVDTSLPNGDAVSLQADVVQYDGGSTFAALPRQSTWLAEAGYFRKPTRLTPFAQVAWRRFTPATIPDQEQAVAGIAYFLRGHKLNVKGALGRARQSGAPASTIVQLTVQSLVF
jgi:hypothetical protein